MYKMYMSRISDNELIELKLTSKWFRRKTYY